MEKDKSINEAELIAAGKAMIADGLGARFMLEKMNARIQDDDIRARVVAAILEKPNIFANNQSKQQLQHDRKIRQAIFAIDDFSDAINKLKRSSITGVFFAFLLTFFALSFGSNNFLFAIFTLITGIGLWFSRSRVNWNEESIILTMLAGCLLFFGLELLVFGLPDPLVPGIGKPTRYKVTYIAFFLNILNSCTWLIYILVRLFMISPLLMIFYKKNELDKISPQYMEAANKQQSPKMP